MRILLSIILLCASTFSNAENIWTDWRSIESIYTYTSEDTLYVWLEGIQCPNTKKYFVIDPTVAANAKQLISMVLAAKMSKSKVNVFYDPEASTAYCYFKGLQIQ